MRYSTRLRGCAIGPSTPHNGVLAEGLDFGVKGLLMVCPFSTFLALAIPGHVRGFHLISD